MQMRMEQWAEVPEVLDEQQAQGADGEAALLARAMRRRRAGRCRDMTEERAAVAGIQMLLERAECDLLVRLPCGVSVPVNAGIGAHVAWGLACDEYAADEIALIESNVRAGDRVLQIGGGVGVTGALAARISGGVVTVVEPDAAKHRAIRRTFQASGAGLALVDALVVAQGPGEPRVDLADVTDEVRAQKNPSGPQAADGVAGVCFEPRTLADLDAQVEPSVVMVELPQITRAWLPRQWGPQVRLVMLRIESPVIGGSAAAGVIDAMGEAGFPVKTVSGLAWMFERDMARRP